MELFVVKWKDLFSDDNYIIGVYDSEEETLKKLKDEYNDAKELTESDIVDYAEFEFNEDDCIINIETFILND